MEQRDDRDHILSVPAPILDQEVEVYRDPDRGLDVRTIREKTIVVVIVDGDLVHKSIGLVVVIVVVPDHHNGDVDLNRDLPNDNDSRDHDREIVTEDQKGDPETRRRRRLENPTNRTCILREDGRWKRESNEKGIGKTDRRILRGLATSV